MAGEGATRDGWRTLRDLTWPDKMAKLVPEGFENLGHGYTLGVKSVCGVTLRQ
jgi:hypothetical protein